MGASYRVKRADWKGSGVRTADVRFGSEADIEARPPDVRFTSESRHRGARLSCPLWAKSGHLRSLGERDIRMLIVGYLFAIGGGKFSEVGGTESSPILTVAKSGLDVMGR